MFRFLPFILIALLVLGGLGYWRFVAVKQNLESPKAGQAQDQTPIEVSKTLPQATLDDRVKALEDLISKVVVALNSLKSSAKGDTGSSTDAKLNSLDVAVTELKVRVSALEKSSPAAPATTTSSSGKSTVYIPLGSGGQMSDTNWATLSTFQISLDPAQYPGYTSMQLEVTMRLNQPGGTLYARLYNSSGGSATSSEVTTTSTTSKLVNSSNFTLATGTKTYVLQAKTSDGTPAFLDYARIKVNF